MAMTLETSPEMETLLRLAAAKNGQTVTDYLLSLVPTSLDVDLSEYAGLEDYAASVAGVQAGLEDFSAGNSISFEDWWLREDARRAEQKPQKQRTSAAEKALAEKAA